MGHDRSQGGRVKAGLLCKMQQFEPQQEDAKREGNQCSDETEGQREREGRPSGQSWDDVVIPTGRSRYQHRGGQMRDMHKVSHSGGRSGE